MKNLLNHIITFFLLIISIIIFIITLCFCLEVFDIIEIPEEFSLEAMWGSKMQTIALGGDIFDDTTLNEFSDNTIRKIVKPERNEVTESNINSDYLNILQDQLKTTENREFNENTNSSNFYYEQLDEYAKIIYNKLNENIDKLKTGTYNADFELTFDELLHQENGKETLDNSFQLAINALTFDNPDLFYIDVTKIYLLTQITTRVFSQKFEVSIGSNGESYLSDNFSDESSINNAINNINQIKDDLLNQTYNKSTVEKIKIVHDYLVTTAEYDVQAGDNIYNIYGTLINKKAVCEGYARTFKYFMDNMGIPCIIACGIGQNSAGASESHAWNYVEIDGKWYAMDVTWDDPIITGMTKAPNYVRYDYFLKGSNQFFKDHFEDGNIVGNYNFKYPALSEVDYEY